MTPSTPRAAAAARALAALAALAACEGPPREIANKCVPDWPSPSPAVAPAPPLAGVAAGTLLWRKPVTRGTLNDWLLLDGDRLAFTAGGRLFLMDRKTGAVVGGRSALAGERVSSAVLDDDGHFVMVGQAAYSVDRDGTLRWAVPLADAIRPGEYAPGTPGAGRSSALSPEGLLYVGASDGAVYAFDARTGAKRWSTRVARPEDGERGPVVLGGIGGAVLAVTRGKGVHPQLLDAATGEPLQRWPAGDGERYGLFAAPSLGIVTQRIEDRGGPYPWMHIDVLDRCGAPRWSLPATRPQRAALIGPGDRLWVAERERDETNAPSLVSVFEPDGTRVVDAAPAAPPWAIGADGTVYAVECDAPGHDGPSRLIAYAQEGATLVERWRLELGASCPMVGPVIADDGVLYFAWFIDQATEIVAVQTGSPGLAPAAWPARRRDARGTAWVK